MGATSSSVLRTNRQMVDIYEKPLSGAAACYTSCTVQRMENSLKLVGRRTLPALYGFRRNSKSHLWVLPLAARQKPFPFHRTEFKEHDGHFSPDDIGWHTYPMNRNVAGLRSPFSPDPSGEAVSDTGDKFLISDGEGTAPHGGRTEGSFTTSISTQGSWRSA